MEKNNLHTDLFEGMSPAQMRTRMKDANKKCASIEDKSAKQRCVTQHLKGQVKEESANKMVDIILTGDYSSYKAINEVDAILDEVENQIDNIPDQDLTQLRDDVVDELSTDSAERDEEEAEDFAEKTVEENMKNAVQLLVTEEEYREYFKGMLKKYNINSPSDLDDSKKKEFFNAVDKGWKGKSESD